MTVIAGAAAAAAGCSAATNIDYSFMSIMLTTTRHIKILAKNCNKKTAIKKNFGFGV